MLDYSVLIEQWYKKPSCNIIKWMWQLVWQWQTYGSGLTQILLISLWEEVKGKPLPCLYIIQFAVPAVCSGLVDKKYILTSAFIRCICWEHKRNDLHGQIQVVNGQMSAMWRLWIQTQYRQAFVPYCNMLRSYQPNNGLSGDWTHHQRFLVFIWKQMKWQYVGHIGYSAVSGFQRTITCFLNITLCCHGSYLRYDLLFIQWTHTQCAQRYK